MATIPPLAQEAIEHARRRDYDRALATAKEALRSHPDDMGLQLFVGMLHTRRMELELAVPYLEAAVSLSPRDAAARLELVRVLIGLGDLDQAERVLGSGSLPPNEADRLRALLLSRRGDLAGAAGVYRRLVQAEPRDFESWGNFGLCLLSTGDAKAAVAALERALELKPDLHTFRDKWAAAHIAAGTAEAALQQYRQLAADQPQNVFVKLSIARLESLLGRPERAVENLVAAQAVEPSNTAVLTTLAELYERQNRLDDAQALLEQVRTIDPGHNKLALIQGKLAARRGDMEEALKLAESAPPLADPALRAQILGQAKDRLGDPVGAWQAYEQMNREDGLAAGPVGRLAEEFRESQLRILRTVTPEWLAKWAPPVPTDREPAFLVGFPRSGTTLLDTFLMGHPDVCVAEEEPMLLTASNAVGAFERLAYLDEPDVRRLRQVYFAEAERRVPGCGDRLLIDKYPFALGTMPLVHRLFPTAPVIFVERHPCDVVLSCLFNRFKPEGAATNFYNIVDAAKLYDVIMQLWTRARELLPLRVHAVRYERMVAKTEAELRSVASFLGLQWSEDIIEHRSTAHKRGFIKTPSYSQVAEPVYNRSVERWRRYEEQMADALPILKPWVEQLGYEL